MCCATRNATHAQLPDHHRTQKQRSNHDRRDQANPCGHKTRRARSCKAHQSGERDFRSTWKVSGVRAPHRVNTDRSEDRGGSTCEDGSAPLTEVCDHGGDCDGDDCLRPRTGQLGLAKLRGGISEGGELLDVEASGRALPTHMLLRSAQG